MFTDNTIWYKPLKILHKSYSEFGSFSAVSSTKCTNLYPFNIKLYTLVYKKQLQILNSNRLLLFEILRVYTRLRLIY